MRKQPETKRIPCRGITRRDFLRLAGVTAASLALAACQVQDQQLGGAGGTALKPVLTAAQVAIAKIQDYEQSELDRTVYQLIDQLGGLGDIVKSGDRVAIKVNMTGGVNSGSLPGVSPIESFITHPGVVAALVKQVKIAGANEVYIVEAAYEWESYTQWGYEEMAADVDAALINLNDARPYDDFVDAPVGKDNFIYSNFIFNKLLLDVDVFMSVSKMKNHYNAGVTHTMKNLYGLVPYRFYTLNKGDSYRSGFHGAEEQTRSRLPRVIIDLNRARPIHFSLVDGIKASQGGEGPWIQTMSVIEPGLLIAGKNPVSTDAVATACMGHDPTANYPDDPFIRCDNHLNLAYAVGLGTNHLEEIEVLGATIDEVKKQFTPAR